LLRTLTDYKSSSANFKCTWRNAWASEAEKLRGRLTATATVNNQPAQNGNSEKTTASTDAPESTDSVKSTDATTDNRCANRVSVAATGHVVQRAV